MRTLGILADRAKKEEINLYTIGEWLDGQWEKTVVHPANDCNDLYSVSKNFTATAVGILCDRGQLSLEQSVYSLFHQEYPHCCGEKWKTVTVAHVLEQTVGIGSGFLDIDVEDIFQYGTRDFLEMALSAPFVYRPGEKMVYSDSNYYLASACGSGGGRTVAGFSCPGTFPSPWVSRMGLGSMSPWACDGRNRVVYQGGGYAAIWATLSAKRNLSRKPPAFGTMGSNRHSKPGASYRNGTLRTKLLAHGRRCCISLRRNEWTDYLYFPQGQPSSGLAGSRPPRRIHPLVELVI